MLRLNELIRDELAELLHREVKDPGLEAMISITEVAVSPDLSVARVYVSVLADEERQVAVLKRLRHAAGFLRREVSRRLHLRRAPDLDFRLDPSLARGARILELLREIESEAERREPEEVGRDTSARGESA